uniref:RNA exonuclease 4-like n=1 Tax=Petromyzon marinus TaxID=7757 RepID=A0AAJ7U8D7_PETMA|nr:RNA exonuclease 4-like [Petromyzon marinus]
MPTQGSTSSSSSGLFYGCYSSSEFLSRKPPPSAAAEPAAWASRVALLLSASSAAHKKKKNNNKKKKSGGHSSKMRRISSWSEEGDLESREAGPDAARTGPRALTAFAQGRPRLDGERRRPRGGRGTDSSPARADDSRGPRRDHHEERRAKAGAAERSWGLDPSPGTSSRRGRVRSKRKAHVVGSSSRLAEHHSGFPMANNTATANITTTNNTTTATTNITTTATTTNITTTATNELEQPQQGPSAVAGRSADPTTTTNNNSNVIIDDNLPRAAVRAACPLAVPPPPPPHKLVAVDCEMVGLGPGGCRGALARCSVVDYYGSVLYDSYVRPEEPVTDYRTRWSGIRPSHMREATPFRAAQREIVQLLHNKVVVGHSIANDFRALGYVHPTERTRDTASLVELRRRAGLPLAQPASLKRLTKLLLYRDIQVGRHGHSSVEDARATMELYRLVETQLGATAAP